MDSPIGKLHIKATDRGLIAVDLEDDHTSLLTNNIVDMTIIQLKAYFQGDRSMFTVPLELKGTEYQQKVWQALLEIPYGKTVSYKDIACKIGNPKGSRSVGGANNKNPILIIVPCHRVIGSNGELVGYGAGLDKKSILLELERYHSS